ncbi:low molecular weight phosphotyrosine protein phosphatase [Pseudomonas viridiflava]|uniref:low molecular weight protein-tyrosine-phosphatase n=1 Tax=Pseudomonas viridiflava TaxID=33069 RepID=UPI001783A091|nr:low molecular weight protein-tyrosine-phosphatase [Pseudomonas viridiflava]MBD8187172.1 low molecular weight phosphotyrosine protein phosphatase [Pseudomonas viridiflava]
MFSNVLVVCVGNICRSPMAVALLRHRLAGPEVRIQSAGIAALSGSAMDPLAKAVLQSHQVPTRRHEARQVNRHLLHQADLILLMEQAHFSRILKLAPEVRGRTFLLGKWQQTLEIADPYRRPKSAFEQTYQHLSRCIDDWLPHLQSGETR